MTNLFKIADCIETPRGIVVAGTDELLDDMSHDDLQCLLTNIHSIAIIGRTGRLDHVKVQEFSITTSVGNRRNVFLLLNPDVVRDSIPTDGIVVLSDK